MEIKVLENEKNRFCFELVGKTHTLPNLLTKALWENPDVLVAGYHVKHPQTSNAVIILETKTKDPKKVLLETISTLKKRNAEFFSAVKKVVK